MVKVKVVPLPVMDAVADNKPVDHITLDAQASSTGESNVKTKSMIEADTVSPLSRPGDVICTFGDAETHTETQSEVQTRTNHSAAQHSYLRIAPPSSCALNVFENVSNTVPEAKSASAQVSSSHDSGVGYT